MLVSEELLSSLLPWNLITLMEGQKRLNSFIKLDSVDLGTMMSGSLQVQVLPLVRQDGDTLQGLAQSLLVC